MNAAFFNVGISAEELEAMTKSQLQAYADENGIEGVNSSKQTKAEMINVILSES